MDSSEEYFLRVLQRTYSGLQDSLIPAHGGKLSKLVQKLEQSSSVTQEVKILKNVQGFAKCSVAMEWLIERTKSIGDEFSPEQFESDVLLLNEKLFEAFLNQPFDMPDFGTQESGQVLQRPVQQHIHMSEDEFLPTSISPALVEPQLTNDVIEEPSAEKPEQVAGGLSVDWSAPAMDTSAFEAALISSNQTDAHETETTPALRDAMDNDLFEMVDRFAQSVIEFGNKMPNERTIATAVIRVAARTAGESARSSGNMHVNDFFTAFLKVISYADEHGKIKIDNFSDVMRDIGDRLAIALQQQSGGITLLKNLTEFINDPKILLSK